VILTVLIFLFSCVFVCLLQVKDDEGNISYSSDRSVAVVLGEGAYGRVLKGRNRASHEEVAIKEVMNYCDKNKKIFCNILRVLLLKKRSYSFCGS
jgi:hypothetical protein